MNAKGPVFKYGDNIDTDVIIPARYLNTQSEGELASQAVAHSTLCILISVPLVLSLGSTLLGI